MAINPSPQKQSKPRRKSFFGVAIMLLAFLARSGKAEGR
jgi:hypothetical protein